MTISRKISLQIFGGTSLTLGRPTVVKLIDPSLAYYRQVRAEVGPDCLIVVRFYHSTQPLDNPAINARDWYQGHFWLIDAIPATDKVVWEGYNEVGDAQATRYCAFETARLALLHGIGRKACVGNWSVGCPDLPVWTAYRPLLLAMRDGDVVGLHEYWSDRADLENVWHVRRFTIPSVAANLSGKQIVITECGRDVVENAGQPGWQLTCGPNEFVDDLARLGQLYDGCPNVIGATVFQTGSSDPQWGPFDVWSIWHRVVAEYAAGAVILPPPVGSPSPVPAPIPYYHSSRGGYRITDIVIHDTEGSAEAAERWFRDPTNAGRSSAHVIVDDQGVVMRLIPDDLAAHHAGYAKIPGRPGLNPNGFSLGIELEYPRAPASPAWPVAQLAAAADVVREWCDKWGITEAHIWEHKTIDPTRRSDPRNWDRAAFLARVWPPVSVPAPEPLPNDEQGTPAVLAQKARWWEQEQERQWAAGNVDRAHAIRLSLIALLTRLEGALA